VGVLEGVRVVDLSVGRAGPLAAMFLGDFGADVVVRSEPDDTPAGRVWSRSKRVDRDALSLAATADVIVTSQTEHVISADASTVVLQVPPFLGKARWAGGAESDGMVGGFMGIALRQASFDGGPVDSICPTTTIIQGVWAAACAVAALYEREISGRGQTVTVSGEHGAMIAAAGALTFRHSDLGAPRGSGGPGGSVPFYRTYRCADGEWLFFGALIPNFTRIGFEVLGLTDLFDDPRLEGKGRAGMLLPHNSPWVREAIAARFAERPRDEWLDALRGAGCPVGAVLDRDDWMDHPQIEAIGMRAERDGGVFPGVPLQLTAGSRGERAGARPASNGPLEGIRVLDLGAIIAGPFSASLLGELGADVIKVEPLMGDSFRGPGFAAYNKGQRSIALDLRSDAGREVFRGLVRNADVVIDNYRPGVLERLGIDHASLERVKPDIITASITGFGRGGPFGEDAGFDPILQAMSGMMKAQGGESDPVFYTVPVNDVAASSVIAFGCIASLFGRARTGEGRRVTTSLAAMSALLQAEALARYDGRPAAPVGSRDHVGADPDDRCYAAADGWFRVAPSDEMLPDDMEAWAAARKRHDAIRELSARGVPAVAVRSIAEMAADTEMYELDILHPDPRPDRDGATAGRHALFSRTIRGETLVAPALGEHTREVLAEIGYADERIEELLSSGAVK
jgi:crotonobetainyl-CoA:carnitine CoA-transferase CaiB-like acyl-CoA transferase